MKVIDVEFLKKKVEEMKLEHAHPLDEVLSDFLCMVVDRFPTIDAMPVAQCKDCPYRKRGID